MSNDFKGLAEGMEAMAKIGFICAVGSLLLKVMDGETMILDLNISYKDFNYHFREIVEALVCEEFEEEICEVEGYE